MHNKFVIIDRKIVITGNYNWSDNAIFRNDENIVILDDVAEIYTDYFDEL